MSKERLEEMEEKLEYKLILFSKLPLASYFTLKSRLDSIFIKAGNRNDGSCNAYLCVDEGEEIDAYDLSVKANAEVVRIDDVRAKMRCLKADGRDRKSVVEGKREGGGGGG